jgi:hypothetical protein
MKVISSRTHGVLDYLVGALLLVAPYLLGFATGGPKQWVPMAIGAATIAMSLITDYELSIARVIPLPVHLGADVLCGILLAASPWLFGFANEVYIPHVVVGIIEIVVPLLTRTSPDTYALRA